MVYKGVGTVAMVGRQSGCPGNERQPTQAYQETPAVI